MNHPGEDTVDAPVIDESACRAYVREIRDLLSVDLFALVVDAGGSTLWTDDPNRADQLVQGLRKVRAPDGEASMQVISNAWVVVQLPLEVSSARPLALRLAIHDEVRPQLELVQSMIRQPLACLGRQIEIDSTLTSSWLRPSFEVQTQTEVDDLLALPPKEDELKSTLENLAEQWRQRAGLIALAIYLPDRSLLVSACEFEKLERKLPQIVERTHAQTLQRRKPMTARMRASSNREIDLFCRSVVDTNKRLLGTVHLFADDPEKSLSSLSRQVSTRLAQWLSRNEESTPLMTRSELIDAMAAVHRRDPVLLSSLAYIDADKVHAINDTFGFTSGDRALEILGRVICENAGPNAHVAHLTSDRYAVFMPGATVDKAVATAERILKFYSLESIDNDQRSISLSASAGIAAMGEDYEEPENMLIVAEVAARAAKERGGNQYALHQDIDDSVIQRRSDVDKVGFLQMALIENKFILFAQKISALSSNRADKYELLTRLEGEDKSVGHPGGLLSAAERYHLMAALDRWVVNTAFTSLTEADNALELSLRTFCINVSAQSLGDDSFLDHIETRIAETGIAAESLCFEITETSLVKNIDRAQRFISRLQRLGCQVALDDFGTGYSSFAYLKNLPVNYLKIDGSFVRDMLESPLSEAIVESIVKIASVTGAVTVAEHVESEALAHALRNLGVDYAQGFAVHRPEPLSNILTSLGEQSSYGIEEPEAYDMIDLGEYSRSARTG